MTGSQKIDGFDEVLAGLSKELAGHARYAAAGAGAGLFRFANTAVSIARILVEKTKATAQSHGTARNVAAISAM